MINTFLLSWVFIIASAPSILVFGKSLPLWQIGTIILLLYILAFRNMNINHLKYLVIWMLYLLIQAIFHQNFVDLSKLLFLTNIFLIYSFVHFVDRDDSGRSGDVLLQAYIKIFFIISTVGALIFVAQLLNIELSMWSRGRGEGVDRQVSSIFGEPAQLGFFMNSVLFLSLVKFPSNRVIPITSLIMIFLSESVGAVITCLFLLSTMFISQLKLKQLVLSGSAVILLLLFNIDVFLDIFERLEREVFSKIYLLGQMTTQLGSGGTRIIGELNAVILTFNNSPVFGLSENAKHVLGLSEYRTMSLNGFAELFINYGFVGLALVFFGLYRLTRIIKPFSLKIIYFLFLTLMAFSDGAIGKLGYMYGILFPLIACRSTRKGIGYADR